MRAMIFGSFFALTHVMAAMHAAAQNPDAATTYNVSVAKCELCTSSACTTSKIIRDGVQTFDIASVGIGQTIGQYASTINLPVGETFSHLRVTLNRTIPISGTVAVAGLGNCGTDETNNSANATTGGVGILGGGGTTQNLFVPNTGVFAGQPTAADYANSGISIVDATTFTFTTALASPLTVGLTPPTFNISFSTATSLQAFNNGGACSMFPAVPLITVTLQ